MGRLLTLNEGLEEVRRLISEGYGVIEAIDKVKSYPQSNKEFENNQDNKITCSIAENEDVDNGEIFQIESGITKKDL